MKKINIKLFKTNADMLSKDVLRYCESFYQYLFHLVNFYGMELQVNELRWLNFLIQRISSFLDGSPTTEEYRVIVGRYSRLLPKLKRIFNEQSSKFKSAE